MNTDTKIRMALVYSGLTLSELARRIGQSPQNLGKKMKRDTLNTEEMEQIAAALGCKWRAEFVFNDGTII